MKNKNLFCILGPSGSGKTTICEMLFEKYGLTQIKSYTTRPQRYCGEIGHLFVDKEHFEQIRPCLCAYTLYNGNEYGCTKNQIETHSLYVIDYNGLIYLREHYTGKKHIYSIYIDVPQITRYERMVCRGDSIDDAKSRLLNDLNSFHDTNTDYNYDVTFTNKNLIKTVDNIYNFISNKNR